MRRLAQALVRLPSARWVVCDAAPTRWQSPRAFATPPPSAAPPCWSCGASDTANAPSLFCGSCRAVRAPPARAGVDLFNLLGV